MKSTYFFKKWKKTAPLGLLLIGTGFSVAGEATLMKGAGAEWWQWVSMGTLGLVIFNAGLSVFGDAIKLRTLYEWHRDHESAS
ncbi:MAG: hypothetical protein AAGI38_01245 [Bacteroidota bacterium]